MEGILLKAMRVLSVLHLAGTVIFIILSFLFFLNYV
jgi:hypothetical protein